MLRLCDRWHKLPSEIYGEDAATLMRLLSLEEYSRGDEGSGLAGVA